MVDHPSLLAEINNGTKLKGDGIRFSQLGEGWTGELADLYLTRKGAWYSRAEAEEAETLEAWRRDAARALIRKRVLVEIATSYPELAAACRSQ